MARPPFRSACVGCCRGERGGTPETVALVSRHEFRNGGLKPKGPARATIAHRQGGTVLFSDTAPGKVLWIVSNAAGFGTPRNAMRVLLEKLRFSLNLLIHEGFRRYVKRGGAIPLPNRLALNLAAWSFS
jgi:hypothetical protein